ncbi:MAG: tetratricopeptide repeat protein [Bryobacteraceae bacterium]|nr:tetratricopeptide repeat protein [Bryobacteraceae bacterium]
MRTAISSLLLGCLAAAQSPAPAPSFEQLSQQARQAYEADRRDQALTLFTQALRLRPAWAQGWWAVGSIHYEAGRPRECRDALQRMVKLDASAAPGWIVLGLCEFDLKQYDSAFESLKRGHTLVPEDSGGPLLDRADYHLALILIHRGAFELSQKLLVKVAWHTPEEPEKLLAAGLAALRIPLWPEEVGSDQREVVTLAGHAFWNLVKSQPGETGSAFAELLARYPRFPNVHYFYGNYLSSLRPAECMKEFEEELRVNPQSVPARVQLTLLYLNEPRLDAAVKLAREAVQMSPDSVGSQLALGRALSASGDDEGALAAFLAARKLDGGSAQIRLLLAGSLRVLGRTEEMRREQAEYDRLKAQSSRWP